MGLCERTGVWYDKANHPAPDPMKEIRDERIRIDSQHFICLNHVVESISSILGPSWADKTVVC